MNEKVIVTETINNVIVSSPGPQGVRGSTILSGNGTPASNLGLTNDFYIDNISKTFYGPKLSDTTWSGASSFQLASIGSELDLAGNNSLTITGIENKTKIDEFSKTLYRTINYELQISKGDEYYSSSLKVLNDGTNINVSESNIISNTSSSLATYTFEENSGIIGLNISPVTTAVTARFYRTALKS